jgi:hypothetical protein
LLSLTLVSQNLDAVNVEGLYEVEVITKSDLKQDKRAAFRQALTMVLNRVLTGKDILQDETVQAVLPDASLYVNEYKYSLATTDAKVGNNAKLMRVSFDEVLLDDVFRHAIVDFWNESRPETLIWLIIEENGKQQFFDPALHPEVNAAMVFASKRKGLPLLYPIYDLKEKQMLSINDVLTPYSNRLMEVSQRYDVVSKVAGKMVNSGTCWRAEWTLYFNAKIEQWSSQCGLITDAAVNGMEGIYDSLAKYYAVKARINQIGSVILKVSNIRSMMQLAEVVEYLNSLSRVKTVTRLGVESGYYIFRIFYQGSRKILNNTLAENQVLKIIGSPQQHSVSVKYKFLGSLTE